MPVPVLVVLILIFVAVPIMAFREGNALAWKQAEWMVSEAKSSSALSKQVEEANRQTAELRQSVIDLAKVLEKLDHSHGQLILRMVNNQVRVRGLQVGEESSHAETMLGRRSSPAPGMGGDETETDGFVIDGKPVDPKVGLTRAIASAQPT